MIKKALILSLLVVLAASMTISVSPPAQAQPPTDQDIQDAIDAGIAWLVANQNSDGSWGTTEQVALTALAVKKLEHHCVDTKWGLGLPSPFDCPYSVNISNGLDYIFENAGIMAISPQLAGDPDSNGNGIGVYFQTSGTHRTYTTGLALMAIAETTTPNRVVDVSGSPVDGWTYKEVVQDAMEYLAFAQNDAGPERGGWGYYENQVGWSDNSNSGFAVLGLQYAQADPPEGFQITIPQFVKDELCYWINYIQYMIPGSDYGGSGYSSGSPTQWIDIYKTGTLLREMEFAGGACGSEQAAIDYLIGHWNDANVDPGWKGASYPSGVSDYLGMYSTMKGLVAQGYVDPAVIDGINWQDDFDTALVTQQLGDGSWPVTTWTDSVLSTEFALLILQKVVPPPPTPQPPPAIPTLSQWGVIAMGILLAAALIWSVRRRWVTSAGKS